MIQALTHGMEIGLTIAGVILVLFIGFVIFAGIAAAIGWVLEEREDDGEGEGE